MGRRGRPRKPLEDARKTVSETRMRLYGLKAEQSKTREAGTVLGRMLLRKVITDNEYAAGERYGEWHACAQRAIHAPDSLVRSNSGSDGGDLVSGEYIDWAIRAVGRWEVAQGWVPEDARDDIERVCVKDAEPIDEPLTKQALAKLVVNMGIEKATEAA